MTQMTLMRVEKIKDAVIHPEQEIRRMAVEYLSDLRKQDPEVMPLVIRAVEKYGREPALLLLYYAQRLVQTHETLEWAVGELEKGGTFDDSFRDSYALHLANLIFHAPLDLIRPFKDRILEAPILREAERKKLSLFFDYEKRPFGVLWERLEELCRKHREDEGFEEDEPVYEALIRCLSRFGEETAGRVMGGISRDCIQEEKEGGHPNWWMELARIELAGALRLEDAAEAILDKFHEDYDCRNDLCGRMLAQVGSDRVVELIRGRFENAAKVFRTYTAETLGHIRSQTSTCACLDLIDREPDLSVRTQLLSSLLGQFAWEGADRVYAAVQQGKWDHDFCDLKEDFAWACMLMGKKYPEAGAWERYAKQQYETRERKTREAFPMVDRLFNKDSAAAGQWQKEPLLGCDPRVLEKTMFDLMRHLREKNPKTVKGVRSILGRMMGKVIPALAPKDSLEAAQDLVYKAFGSKDKAERIKLAREALQLSENCVDAYVILGEETDDLEEAIRWYRKGVEAGERFLGEDFFRENKGRFWGIFETRPYMRARFNLAEALWYDNKKKESLAHLRALLDLDPNDNQGVRYFLAGRLLETGHHGELLDLMQKRYSDDATAEWRYTNALLYYEIYGDSEVSRACLEEAVESNKHVPDYLLGLKEIPETEFQTVQFGGEDEAIYYCRENGELWWRNEKAMQWFERQVYPSEPKRREGAKIGRNDLCPCGSGKKYKKCCGSSENR
ncbi:MAG: SEC-C metal-binding domain-containing protein [Candidatus Omnitrophica bacterium]|nr:SEC-C metal-binding domain-containing protein [Candidatus Omnitrophota bacterium]